MTIHELSKLPGNGTDKQNLDHAFAGRNYLHYYERHFEVLRDMPIKLLEIGVNNGDSLRLWRDYFPQGEIHGLDINPACLAHEAHRISVHIGDQNDSIALGALSAHGPFDIIIDDGSHYVPHILSTFVSLWSDLKPGGWYVWEDMRLSYQNVDMAWPGMTHNTTCGDCVNHREEINDELLLWINNMDFMRGDVASMHLYSMLYFFEKTNEPAS